jgi:hypothetical protein
MYRASSEFDRQRIGELAQQFGLKPLLDEVLNERDELA